MIYKLVGFDFPIIYKHWKQKSVVDALSRNLDAYLMTISSWTFNLEQYLNFLNQSHSELLAKQQGVFKNMWRLTWISKSSMGCYFLWACLWSTIKWTTTTLDNVWIPIYEYWRKCWCGKNIQSIGFKFFVGEKCARMKSFVINFQICQLMNDKNMHATCLFQYLPLTDQVFGDTSMKFYDLISKFQQEK